MSKKDLFFWTWGILTVGIFLVAIWLGEMEVEMKVLFTGVLSVLSFVTTAIVVYDAK